MAVKSLASVLVFANANGSFIPYAGSSCTNQVPTSVSAAGSWSCSDVTDSFFSGQLAAVHGGTGKDFSASSGVLAFNSGTAFLTATSSTGFYATGGTNGNVLGITNGVVGWVATTSGAGGSPGGSGTEIQYRNGANFGAVTNSSFSSTGGEISFGTSTANLGLLTLGSSTAPELLLSDNVVADSLLAFNYVGQTLFIATSTATATTSQPIFEIQASSTNVSTTSIFSTLQVGTTSNATTTAAGMNAALFVSNGLKSLGGIVIRTWTNVTNAFAIINAAGNTVFAVDDTVSRAQLYVGTSTAFDVDTVFTALNPPAGNGSAATTTIDLGDVSTTTSRFQQNLRVSAGNLRCAYVSAAGAWVITASGTACTP